MPSLKYIEKNRDDLMATFKLIPYFIRVKKKRSDEYLDLNRIPSANGKNITIHDIFLQLCSQYSEEVYMRETERKTMFIEDVESNDDFISGIIKTGEYGYETDFYDIKQERHIPSAKKEEHSDERPFFFLFHHPQLRNSDIGIMILQKFKQFGTKMMLEKALRGGFSHINSTLSVEMHPIIRKDLISRLESVDRLMELKLIKRKIPKDVADKNLIDNYEDVYEERSFKVKRNKNISLKKTGKEILDALKNIEYPYVEIEEEKYDEVKLIVKSGGSDNTISLDDVPKLRENMPLNEENLQFERGFPTKEILLSYGKKYVNNILNKYDENFLK